jgi:2-phospho-L-lactate/phosphoenolpyruvate guanylyltransferase
MRALLLPVKDLRNAKQRLAGILTADERRGLAQAMLADTVRALRAVRRADKIFVVTNYAPAIEIAQQNCWHVLHENQQISESVSVDAASLECERRGVTALLRLPLDIPLVQPIDLDDLLEIHCHPPGLVIVPSRDGTGTNAILRTPPSLFPSHFGSGSFAKHCAEAERTSANIVKCRNIRLEMDVDDEADLRALLEHDLRGTRTGEWLVESGVADRLRSQRDAQVRVATKA